MTKIVSNTGPIISLEKLRDGFNFIHKLYEKIILPPAVLQELSQGDFTSPLEYLRHFKIEDLIEIKPVQNICSIYEIERLDEGEKQAISLAIELNLPLLIEETIGRRLAISAGVHISGIAGQTMKAYKEKIIADFEAKAKLQELLDAGRINRRIYDKLMDSF